MSYVIFGIRANINLSKTSRSQSKTRKITTKKKKKKKTITAMSSTTRKLSLSFPYLVPKSCPIVVLSIRRPDIKPTKDSNPKTHNQVSKSLVTTKTERREIRVLQSCHTTTNKQPRSDLVESFHDSCYACRHHHLHEPPLRLVLTVTFILRRHDFSFAQCHAVAISSASIDPIS